MEIVIIIILSLALLIALGITTAAFCVLVETYCQPGSSTCSHLYKEKRFVGYLFTLERFEVRCKQCNEVVDEYIE